MFILDSLMISGIRWALQTVATAADAEMNDDGALREQLLEAEMRREMGELSDDEFRRTEASLLARIREIRERREGGAGPLGFTTLTSDDAAAERVQVEASLTGDFHLPSPPATAGQVPPAASAASPSASAARQLRGIPAAAATPAARSAEAEPPPGRTRSTNPLQPRKQKSARKTASAGPAGKHRT
jgi:hypothetical protein